MFYLSFYTCKDQNKKKLLAKGRLYISTPLVKSQRERWGGHCLHFFLVDSVSYLPCSALHFNFVECVFPPSFEVHPQKLF